jgi:hypothetical protein
MDYLKPLCRDIIYDHSVRAQKCEDYSGQAYLEDGSIALSALDELLKRQSGVLVTVHVLEDLFHSLNDQFSCHRETYFVSLCMVSVAVRGSRTEADLFGRVLVFWKRDHMIGHLVDRPDDLEHLVGGDGPIAIDVVELEGP